MDPDILKPLVEALERRGVDYAFFGAVAMNLHGLVRATEDIDLFVAPDAGNIERLRLALDDVFSDPAIAEITSVDLLGEYPSVRYGPPHAEYHLDILTRLGTAFAFADLEIQRVPIDDLTAAVVSPHTLYRMKRDTVRLKDKADAALLRDRFGLKDE